MGQPLSNSALYKHICLENTKYIYKLSGKCDDQQQYKANIEADTVATPEVFTDNIPMSYA